jgi:hypothetical protein
MLSNLYRAVTNVFGHDKTALSAKSYTTELRNHLSGMYPARRNNTSTEPARDLYTNIRVIMR